MQEIWKDIKEYEGLYQVSNLGRIKSLERYVNHSRCGKQKIKEKITFGKQTSGNKNDYKAFQLSMEGNVNVVKVHQLVAQAFIPNPENKKYVNHINGIKTDNRSKNLEWVTPKENSVHASLNGLCSTYWLGKGGKGYFANKKIIQYDLNMNYIETHESVSLAGKKLGIHPSNISKCANNKIKRAGGFIWKYESNN